MKRESGLTEQSGQTLRECETGQEGRLSVIVHVSAIQGNLGKVMEERESKSLVRNIALPRNKKAFSCCGKPGLKA